MIPEFASHLETLVGSKSSTTVRAYKNGLTVLSDYLERKGIAPLDVTPDMLFDVRKRHDQYAASTWNVWVHGMASFYNRKVAEGLLPRSPVLPEHYRNSIAHQDPDPLTPEDVDRMVVRAQQDGLPWGLVMYVLAHTGLRVAELCNLTVGDLKRSAYADDHAKDPYYLFVRGKGNKPRKVGVTTEMYETLQAYLRLRIDDCSDDSPLFIWYHHNSWAKRKPDERPRHVEVKAHPLATKMVERRMRKWGEEIGLKATPHDMRRYFTTRGAVNGVPLPLLQYTLGHASPRTTMRYFNPADRDIAGIAGVIAAELNVDLLGLVCPTPSPTEPKTE